MNAAPDPAGAGCRNTTRNVEAAIELAAAVNAGVCQAIARQGFVKYVEKDTD